MMSSGCQGTILCDIVTTTTHCGDLVSFMEKSVTLLKMYWGLLIEIY